MDILISDGADRNSDYGSDFTLDEEEILVGLLQQSPEVDNPIHEPDLQLKSVEDNGDPQGVRLPRRMGSRSMYQAAPLQMYASSIKALPIEDGERCNILKKIESEMSRSERQRSASIEAPLDPAPETPDLRSPLERFRTKPKKALSVTDLISPSWCELQYWYVLTKHGKKRRTPAMKQGSAVHKTLEDEVHTTVAVDIQTKEDAWGLRIWNVIQGLRTLRETGMTRELEIWGLINGLVVNGVIDEVSHLCPDRELEEAGEKEKAAKNPPATDQATITDYLGSAGTLEANGACIFKNLRSTTLEEARDKVYLTDVKTRGVKSIPKGASFRPTLLQLMLYRHLLSDLATNKVDADIIFDRFELDPDAVFTDSFIAQIGSLNEGFYDGSQDPPEGSQEFLGATQDSMSLLLAHNCLRALWALMINEFAHTLPAGADSVGKVLKAEYRDQSSGQIQGVKTFLYDELTLNTYLDNEMRWWRGERAPQGVCIEEAYKCGYCEFAEECSWRKNKIEDATRKMRERKRSVI